MPRGLIILPVLVLAVLAGIFLLARQSTKGTQDLAWRTEQLLMRLIPPTGTGSIGEPTWCGLTIRRLAHVAEYALLGLAVTACALVLWGATPRAVVVAVCFCFAVSLADELHKIFVPGRHFDAADLALDAGGYLPAVLLCTVVAAPLI